jgi:hypothetical protein
MMRRIIYLVWLLIPGIGNAQEHARVLSHTTTYVVRSEEDAEIHETYRILIHSEKGKMYADFQDYTDKFRKITSVTLDVYSNGKRVKRMNRADGLEIGFNPSYEISDAKVLLIRPDYQNYPFEVEVSSTVKLNGYMSLPPWIPRAGFNLAVDRSTFILERPEALDPRLKEQGITGQTQSGKGILTTTYEIKELPAVDRKVRYRDFYDAQPKVLVSPKKFRLSDAEGSLETWSAFGDWFLSLNSDPYELDPKTKALIDTMDKSNRIEFIRKLYEYMQDKTRYVSIQLGIGGFKSLPTEDVEKYGYGDCKALSTYMRNMLDYAGVKSNYILVRAGNDAADVLADFPSNQFNHVYIGVPMPADTVYLECTSQISPSNYTGTFTDDRNVLWIDKGKSKIIRSRIYDHTLNVRKSNFQIQLSESGDATLKLDVENQGTFFDEIMIYKSAPPDYVQQYNQNKFTYSDFTLKNFTYSQGGRDQAIFRANYGMQINSLAKPAGNRLVFPGMPATPVKKFVDGDDMMKYASIRRGVTVEDNIEVTLPQNFWIYSLPEKESVKSPYGSYELSSEFDGSKLTIKRKLVLHKGDYTQKEWEKFKEFYQQLDRIESRKLVLNSKT